MAIKTHLLYVKTHGMPGLQCAPHEKKDNSLYKLRRKKRNIFSFTFKTQVSNQNPLPNSFKIKCLFMNKTQAAKASLQKSNDFIHFQSFHNDNKNALNYCKHNDYRMFSKNVYLHLFNYLN